MENRDVNIVVKELCSINFEFHSLLKTAFDSGYSKTIMDRLDVLIAGANDLLMEGNNPIDDKRMYKDNHKSVDTDYINNIINMMNKHLDNYHVLRNLRDPGYINSANYRNTMIEFTKAQIYFEQLKVSYFYGKASKDDQDFTTGLKDKYSKGE